MMGGMTKSTLLLPIGIPASGKTTWRRKKIDEVEKMGETIGVISPDEIREEYFKVQFNPKYEAGVWRLAELKLRDCLDPNSEDYRDYCILDATNVKKVDREMPLSVADEVGAEKKAVYFKIHPEYAELRNEKRREKGEWAVPEEVIYTKYYQLRRDIESIADEFDSVEFVPQLPSVYECKEMGGYVDAERSGGSAVCRLFDEITIDLTKTE
jgi:predicted kinase